MTAPIRVLLVDDQHLIRLGFRLVLDAEPDIEVIGEAADGRDAISETARLDPDVILMDVRMPVMDGITATERIVATHPGVRILILTTFDLDEYAFAALRAGASGFLLKDAQRAELVGAVRAVHGGDAALAPRVTRRLIELVGPGAVPATPLPGSDALTDRERDVFRAIADGRTNSEIARDLFLSESTVKTHVGRVLTKIGARDRVHAVILAHRHGMTDTR
ncbi:response regulator transcription factor [Microbacterium sp. SLBN-146]|uniref:response regulator n=1 Tax=Microbacterium sp. SLBN-146 TaxID=2768457 RepID=UPI001151F8E4|nr:response regulator transcription factor [Microbacterium sp. SLBN-146]TQJ32004.1 LuxR family two component transcriptional regulator [Microbacterium sp. SLBN-146]